MYYLSHWTPAWPVLAVWAVLAVLHGVGVARRRDGEQQGHAAGRVWAFQGGLVIAVLALVSPLAYWAGLYIWVRSVQDLLLGVVVPALIVLGRPGGVLARVLRRPVHGVVPDASSKTARTPWWLRQPVAVAVVFNAVWLGWHLPVLYDLGHTNAAVRYLGFAMYLGAGVAFWLQLFGSARWAPAAPAMRRLWLLVATVIADTILGMVLVFGSGVLYPAYRGTAHHALSVVADQQVGGGVLWMGMLPPLVIASVALLLRWLEHDESDELSRELDRLTRQPAAGRSAWASSGRGAWLARPGDRRPTI